MYPEFAYSRLMQLILAAVTVTETFCTTYLLSNLLLSLTGLTAGRRPKLLFAFLTGTLLQNMFVYGIYIWGGMVSFPGVTYLLVSTPNPFLALMYYFIAQKTLRLSPVRSIKIMSYVYLFWLLGKALNRLSGAFFFMMNEERYNYMKDAFQQISYFAFFFAVCLTAMVLIRKSKVSLKFSDNMFFNKRRELAIYFAKALFAYTVMLLMPIMVGEPKISSVLTLLTLLLFIAVILCLDIISYNRQTLSHHEVHISALFKGLEDLRGIKHDFNNILHTYSGFLELEEYGKLREYHASLVAAASHAGSVTELAQRMHENPAIVTLLINKLEYAEKSNVKFLISLKCGLSNLYVDNLDFSRILGSLLDNAIEAAGESGQRKAYLTVEAKAEGSKHIIVTNTTADRVDTNAIVADGITTKTGHSGIGLTIVRSILGKYGNCSFQMKYYNYEFSVYIELKETE